MAIGINGMGRIGRLTLRVNSDSDDLAPWLVVLGENSVGKSSVLHALWRSCRAR